MRLFIRRCNHCGRRIYLSIIASSREQLADRITYSFEIQCPHCRNYSYHTVEDVFAEIGASSVPPGAILGGLIGLVGGPLGALIGGADIGSRAYHFGNNFYEYLGNLRNHYSHHVTFSNL